MSGPMTDKQIEDLVEWVRIEGLDDLADMVGNLAAELRRERAEVARLKAIIEEAANV